MASYRSGEVTSARDGNGYYVRQLLDVAGSVLGRGPQLQPARMRRVRARCPAAGLVPGGGPVARDIGRVEALHGHRTGAGTGAISGARQRQAGRDLPDQEDRLASRDLGLVDRQPAIGVMVVDRLED